MHHAVLSLLQHVYDVDPHQLRTVQESEKAARQTQEQLMQASAAVAGLQDELQALKARLASQATAEQVCMPKPREVYPHKFAQTFSDI